tara:strand:- start:240 stop:356 length:117 start_codon:yes stop_codon:yes gene_type:complete
MISQVAGLADDDCDPPPQLRQGGLMKIFATLSPLSQLL